MAKWGREVGKMAMYLIFPVGMFWFFNHPQFFEKYLISSKEKIGSAADSELNNNLEELEKIAEAIERKRLEDELLARGKKV